MHIRQVCIKKVIDAHSQIVRPFRISRRYRNDPRIDKGIGREEEAFRRSRRRQAKGSQAKGSRRQLISRDCNLVEERKCTRTDAARFRITLAIGCQRFEVRTDNG
jgi:hypothetical protein